MTVLLWITRTALLGAAISSILLARRRKEHRPVAVFVTTIASIMFVRPYLLARFGLAHAPEEAPFVGLQRAAFHIEEALFLTWAFGLAAMSLAVFASRRWAALAALAWVALSIYLATHYPAVRGDSLRDVYAASEVAALCVSAGATVTWTWRKQAPGPEHLCALLVILVDAAATLAGSLRWGLWTRYDLDQVASAMLFTLLTGFQVFSWKLQRLPCG